ncbi:GLPGLI family protein [Chryseobacterium sp.]|jgi:GLPGLI family protein|uniref:GLPGLI family protein n=1 Tax=Chryseobacterium sp. TaxID=1871047 RepID=UPI002629D006|nr:GLPGLI family protein [Chryseobacterium sp.]
MLKYLLFSSMLSFVSIFSQEKNDKEISELQIQYEYSFVRDTTDLDQSHRVKELMLLDLNSNTSLFYSQQYMVARNVFKQAAIDAQNNKQVNINTGDLPKYNINYYVFRQNSKVFVTANIDRDSFTFENSYLKWNTNYNDVKTILGYKCNKATTVFNKRLYIAWYTKDIPISEGPYRFKGLTGLILELNDENNFHAFKAIGIEKKQVEISPLQKGIPVTREQYLKKKEEFKSNPYPQRKNLTKERRDQMIEAFKKDNSMER